ncbi:MAG: acyl--CoA ligase, partial [Candidatus Eremiobacteraeota bacterium]|nr:acyl--CoA ligase [Candidatus Eremiobacteraeota bacterium]
MKLIDQRLGTTLADVLRENALTCPNREALSEGATRLDWQALYLRALDMAAHLRAFGLVKGDRVAVVLGNQIECLLLYWACALSGCVFVGANPRLGTDELSFILDHSGASVIFAPPHSAFEGLELSGAREMVVVDATRADNIFARPIDPQSETLAFESISSS